MTSNVKKTSNDFSQTGSSITAISLSLDNPATPLSFNSDCFLQFVKLDEIGPKNFSSSNLKLSSLVASVNQLLRIFLTRCTKSKRRNIPLVVSHSFPLTAVNDLNSFRFVRFPSHITATVRSIVSCYWWQHPTDDSLNPPPPLFPK